MATATDLDVSLLNTGFTIASTTSNEDDSNQAFDSLTPSLTWVEGQDGGTGPSHPADTSTQSAEHWASLIRQSYNVLCNGGTIDKECLKAPRRRHADQKSADLAHEVAGLLYPSHSDSNVPQVIRYEKDIVLLRKIIQAKQKADELARVQARNQPEWKQRVLSQGPWDEINDPLPLTGSPALPMPVSISDEESLAAFFNHLSVGGTHDILNGSKGQEPHHGVDTAEFEKGILYEDGRMDLCKIICKSHKAACLLGRALNAGSSAHHLEDDVVDSAKTMVSTCQTLRMLELGTTGMSLSALESLYEEITASKTLLVFSAKSVYYKVAASIKLPVNERIKENIQQFYRGIDAARFNAGERRWLISPRDVRLIDSAYRNRDTGLARRGQLILKKLWQGGMETVNGVMNADNPQPMAEMKDERWYSKRYSGLD